MSTSERIILDPGEVAGNRQPLDITDWVRQEGIDWGDAVITPFMADRDRGSFPVDFQIPNRDISIPLRFVNTVGGTTTTEARANIQAKVAQFQKEGGWVKRVLNTGGVYFADIVNGATEGFSSTAGFESGQNADIDPSISLTCLPDFYQDEITLSDHTETAAAELVFTQTAIEGDYPARVRVVVDDDQSADQRGLIWAFRSRYYDSASTAQLAYEAERLTALDTAAAGVSTGASGGTAIGHLSLASNWTPVMGTDIGGTSSMTHHGTYRVFARIGSNSGTTVQCRFVWDVGDLINPTTNDAWRLPGALPSWYVHDFGEVRLDAAPVGTHRWGGQIQAKGDAGGENFGVDKIWMVPVDEGMGVLKAQTPGGWGATTYSARDEFNQGGTAAVTGKVLPVGGTWTVAGTACDATDFTMTSGAATISRNAVSDTGTGANVMAGRGISAGAASYANVSVGVDLYTSPYVVGLNQGAYARFVDTSNYVMVALAPIGASSAAAGTPAFFGFFKVKAGVTTTLGVKVVTIYQDVWYSLLTGINPYGVWSAYLTAGTSSSLGGTGAGLATLYGSDADLATGGTLATGKAGIFDQNSTASVSTRQYDNFLLSQLPSDAVIFSGRSAQLTSDGHFRLDATGAAYGPVSIPDGDLPRLPVAGLEGRTTEVFLKNSRGDFDQVPDLHSGTDNGDNVSARIFYRPCYLNVGES